MASKISREPIARASVNSATLILSTILVLFSAQFSMAEVNDPTAIPLATVATESQRLSQFLSATAQLGDTDSRVEAISEGIGDRTKEVNGAAVALSDSLTQKPTLEQLSELAACGKTPSAGAGRVIRS